MFPGLDDSLALTLLTHHSMRVTVNVLTLDHEPVSTISHRVLDGSVNVDLDAEVSRSATMTFLDPESALDFDSNSPADGALYADRMLSITYDVRLGVLGSRWIEVPIFTGPVTKFSRDGVRVKVEAQGKEALAMGSPWRTYTAKKNRKKVEVIEDVMRSLTGETLFALVDDGSRLPGDKVLTSEGTPWAFCRKLAQSMGLHLFYDGAGRLRLREFPRTALFTFADGNGGSIVEAPSVEFSTEGVRNSVSVTGKKPKGAKAKVRARVVAPADHPLSPQRLGRGGRPRHLAEFIDDPDIGSDREAEKVANERLASLLSSFVDVKFSAVTIPHLDAGDYVLVQTERFSMTTRLRSFSLPLTSSGTMSVGFNRRTSPNRKAIR